jgi:hypothetical protein
MSSSGRALIALGIFVGLLFLVLGHIGSGHQNLLLAGEFVFAFTLIWGGLTVDEPVAVRASMVAIGGLFAIAAFAGPVLNMASLLGG